MTGKRNDHREVRLLKNGCPFRLKGMRTTHHFRSFCSWRCLLVFALMILIGCETQLDRDQKEVDRWMTQARRFVQQKHLFEWFLLTRGQNYSRADFYKEFRQLFSLPRVRFVDRVMQQTGSQLRVRELQYFKTFLLREMFALSRAASQDQLYTYLLNTPLALKGKTVRLIDLPYAVATLEQARERRRLYRKGLNRLAPLDTTLIGRQKALLAFVQRTGFDSLQAWYSFVSGFGSSQVFQLARQVLAATDSLYRTLLEAALAEKQPLSMPEFWYLRAHLPDLPAWAPAQGLEALQSQAGLFGESLPVGTRFTLDLSDSAGKIPLSRCLPVTVPEDVRITHRPWHSGRDWVRLSELFGEGEHFSNTLVKQWTFRQAGRGTALKALAYLWELMWEDSTWLAEHFSTGPDTLTRLVYGPDYRRSLVLYRLLELRLAAAEVLLQSPAVLTAGDPLRAAQSVLRQALNLHLEGSEQSVLIFFEQEYSQAADRFLGQILAYQIRRRLEERFGAPWYRQAPAIRYVKTVWRRGLDWPLPSFLHSLQLRTPDLQPLLDSLSRMLEDNHRSISGEEDHEAAIH
ncbi:MAG: hypothetical protein D6715_06155 [Calditrichaeota bacterium]|nr:MAG: hypothetical protein D6715_06155 [Calditrichota bacterium]